VVLRRAFSKYESPAKQASDSRPRAGEKEDFGVLAGGFATGQHPKPRLCESLSLTPAASGGKKTFWGASYPKPHFVNLLCEKRVVLRRADPKSLPL
jgi:hypothetical protein